jgi:hypothetical protein
MSDYVNVARELATADVYVKGNRSFYSVYIENMMRIGSMRCIPLKYIYTVQIEHTATYLVVAIDGGMPALAVARLRKPCANDGT